MRRTCLMLFALMGAAATSTPSATWAQGRYAPQGEAQRHFQRGERLLAEANQTRAEGETKASKAAFTEATEAFEQALEEDPNYVAVYPKLGAALYSLEQSAEAVSLLRKGKAKAPENLEITFWLGNHLLALKKTKEALSYLDVVARADTLPQVHLVLGDHHYGAGDYATAQQHLARYVAEQPDDLNAQAKLGNAWFKLGQPAKALEAFQAVQRRDPENLLVRINIGNAHYALGNYAEAIQVLEKAEQQAPDRPSVVFNLAQSRFKLEQHAEALAGYERFLALKPRSFNGHYFKGSALYALGRNDEALRALERSASIKADVVHPWYKAGLIHLQSNRTAAARDALKKAQALAPDDPWVLSALATVARREGKADQAITLLQRAVQLKPGSGRLHGKLGQTLAWAGRLDDALAETERSLELAPQDAWVKQAAAQVLSAHSQQRARQGDQDQARRLVDRALLLRPDDQALQINAALLMIDAGQSAEAQQRLTALVSALPETSPLTANALYALGLALMARGQHDAATQPLMRAAAMRPEAHFAGATTGALVAAGRAEEAMTIATEALQRWPEDPTLQKNYALASLARAWSALSRGNVRRSDVTRALTVRDTPALQRRARYVALIQALRRADTPRARVHLAALEAGSTKGLLSKKAPADHLKHLSAIAEALQGRWAQVYGALKGTRAGRGAGAPLLRHAALQLATAAWNKGDIKGAIRWLGTAQKLKKSSASATRVKHNQAVLQIAQGQGKRAEKTLRALMSQIPEAQYNLALALDAQGRQREATALYETYGQGNGPKANQARRLAEIRRRIFGEAR
ncbi:MAG: tetratricopeptide repeat protein [Bradymonadia bacterium]